MVSNSFNPYHAWLGLDASNANPSYEELLAIEEPNPNHQDVSVAFDRAIARVRSHKPGPHAAQWAKLIDELKAAKLASAKIELAQLFATRAGAATDAPATSTPSSAPSDASLQASASSAASPENAASQNAASQNAPDPVLAALGLDDDVPDFTTPDEELESPDESEGAAVGVAPAGALNSESPSAPPELPGTPELAGAPEQQGTTESLGAQPAPPHLSAPQPTQPLNPAAQMGVATADAPSSVAAAASQRGGNMSGLLIGFCSCAATITLLGVGYIMWFGPPSSKSEDEVAKTPDPVRQDAPENDGDANPLGNPVGLTNGGNGTGGGTGSDTGSSGNGSSDNDASDSNTADADATDDGTDDSDATMDNMPEDMATTGNTPPAPMEERELTDEQLKQLADKLTAARTKLSEQDIPGAKALLEEAKPMVGTTSHMAMIERLEALSVYLEAFHNAVSDGLAKLSPGDSLPVGEVIVAIVEKKPDSVIIHVAGRNREYALNKLSLGLGLALADQALDQEAPISMVAKGAFQAVHPRASEEHIQEVRDWWRDATDAGAQIEDLLLVLDDDYARMAGIE